MGGEISASFGHYLRETQGNFVYSEDKHPDQKAQKSRRTASSTMLSDEDPVVQCIAGRATKFVGFMDHDGVESFQLVKYQENERHDPHHDWFFEPRKKPSGQTCNRVASFFLYLGENPIGGETCFHHLYPAPVDADPSKFSNINSDDGLGFAVKPITGNAMFWMNLHANNTGDVRTIHSALPIRAGVKYGINILLKRCYGI
ncbi:prolyl 4-hydroxylase alpha subunit, putative [Talaromyces stipitatus ATCC 10500]|uniref:Prolyl 4-hydroxylase alpha subunit, putative n=1 Tax=Talaromyces stipitatus (strain ATCC 10500 / CBS 375.48 / QM 6759 / NRRL 1006) TaxID=441959 RepID=B8MCN8_TALSN|nr:prolyl 4-hydroxylase alpha subunit, putative [Talaromyces stipitatus ATCC 10500]EED18940.1 prolyl 4-hydroxylase alpha subunit, putative [Talaromyces stipitatus ATCC 10500]